MDVDQAETGIGTPVSQQSLLGVLELERLMQQRILPQVDHAKA